MPRENEQSFLRKVLKNNLSAVEFCNILFCISQTLDDLIDGDNEVKPSDLIVAFWSALVDLPRNKFYREHEHELAPLIPAVLQDYVDSVALERSTNERHRHIAFVLRDQLASVVVQCARLVGGYGWMQRVSIAIRDHFHEDEFGDYVDSLPGAKPVEPDPDDPEQILAAEIEQEHY